MDVYHSIYGKEIKSAYALLSNYIMDRNCKFVGLDIGADDCEYPIWVTLMAKGINSFQIKHVNVHNPSQKAVSKFADDNVCVIFKKRGRHVRIYAQKQSATQVNFPKQIVTLRGTGERWFNSNASDFFPKSKNRFASYRDRFGQKICAVLFRVPGLIEPPALTLPYPEKGF